MKTIGVFVGSLRRDSFTNKVAQQLGKLLEEQYKIKFISLKDLEMFNQDYDDDNATPNSWKVFRDEVKGVDAVLFVTPEYNRSIPPVLKNALDIGSRPYGANVWDSKPGAVVSVSPGAIGGFGANHHLRQVLSFLNVATMQQPEVYLGNVVNSLDEDGNLIESTNEFLKGFTSAFAAWIERIS